MTWKSSERLDALGYQDKIARDAFRAGYSDGYYYFPRIPADWPHGVYNAAYHAGRSDSKEDSNSG